MFYIEANCIKKSLLLDDFNGSSRYGEEFCFGSRLGD